MATAILIALIFGPAVLVWLLRANGALAFLSLCAGYVVFNFSSNDINRLFGQLHTSVNSSLVSLALVLLPPMLTLVLTHHGISKSRRFGHLMPGFACGGLLALAAVPLLTDSVSGNFYTSSLWAQLTKYQSEVVGFGVLVSLLLVWAEIVGKPKDKKKKS